MTSAHDWLKGSTAAAHRRVDEAFSGFALDDAASYRSFLVAHAFALLPIEAWLEGRAEAVLPDWRARARSEALKSDLQKLDATATAGEAFEAADDPASIAGVVYVLEGSRIGGNILAKRVPAWLPKSYLSSPCDARTWRGALSRFDEIICDAAARAASAKAALSAFERFERAALSAPFHEGGQSVVHVD